MVNFLPAVVIGGPPHAGKSVLFYSLTKALRERVFLHFSQKAMVEGVMAGYRDAFTSR